MKLLIFCSVNLYVLISNYGIVHAQSVPGYIFAYDASGIRISRTYSTTVLLKRSDSTQTNSLVGGNKVSIFPNPTSCLLKVNISGIGGNMPAKVYPHSGKRFPPSRE